MEQVYLVVKKLDEPIDGFIIPLINGRGNAGKEIFLGDTWQDLKDAFAMRVGEPGRGELIVKQKDSVPYWVLPFAPHPLMQPPADPAAAMLMDKQQLNSYGWDIIDPEI